MPPITPRHKGAAAAAPFILSRPFFAGCRRRLFARLGRMLRMQVFRLTGLTLRGRYLFGLLSQLRLTPRRSRGRCARAGLIGLPPCGIPAALHHLGPRAVIDVIVRPRIRGHSILIDGECRQIEIRHLRAITRLVPPLDLPYGCRPSKAAARLSASVSVTISSCHARLPRSSHDQYRRTPACSA